MDVVDRMGVVSKGKNIPQIKTELEVCVKCVKFKCKTDFSNRISNLQNKVYNFYNFFFAKN